MCHHWHQLAPAARITETAHSFVPMTLCDTVIEASGMADICRLGPGHPYVLGDLKHLKQGSRILPHMTDSPYNYAFLAILMRMTL